MIKWLFCLYVGLQCSGVFANDLNKGLVAYWNFDESGYAGNTGNTNLFRRAETKYEPGKRGMGMLLTGDSDYLELVDGFVLNRDFSFAFWFKPDNPSAFQTLVQQFQVINGSVETLYKIELTGQTIRFVYGPNYEFDLALPGNIIENSEWHFVSVVKQGGNVKLSLGNQLGNFSQTKAFNYDLSQAKYAQLLFGMGEYAGSAFTGNFDEIMIYDRAVNPIVLEKLLNGKNPVALILGGGDLLEANIEELAFNETADMQKVIPPPVNTASTAPLSFQYYVGRRLYLQDSTTTPHHKFVLELWDYDRFDNDTIAVFLNGNLLADNVLVPPRKNAHLIEFELLPGKDNYLSFVALNKGQGGGNTTEIRIWNDHKTILKDQLVITPFTNAIMKIKQEGTDTRELSVVRTIEVEYADLTMEIWDKSIEDNDFVTVYCNGDTLLNYHEIETKHKRISLNLYKNHLNTLVFVAEDAGTIGNNTARVRLYKGEKLLDEFTVTSTYRKNSAIQITVVDPITDKRRKLRPSKT